MKNYKDYIDQANYISLGKLCVYNDVLEPKNKIQALKELDGYIFMFLADADYNDLLGEYFKDYSSYFDIELFDKEITKEGSTKKYNVYKLLTKF